MKRIIYKKLLEWKNTSNGKTALLIDGARRVGKSYIAEEFARNEYASYAIVDFAKASKKVKRLFDEYLDSFLTKCKGSQRRGRRSSILSPTGDTTIWRQVRLYPCGRTSRTLSSRVRSGM